MEGAEGENGDKCNGINNEIFVKRNKRAVCAEHVNPSLSQPGCPYNSPLCSQSLASPKLETSVI